jgi:hypothetical protein
MIVHGLAALQVEVREIKMTEIKSEIAPLSDKNRIIDGFGTIGEEFLHLIGRTEIKMIRRKTHPFGIVKGFAGLDA